MTPAEREALLAFFADLISQVDAYIRMMAAEDRVARAVLDDLRTRLIAEALVVKRAEVLRT